MNEYLNKDDVVKMINQIIDEKSRVQKNIAPQLIDTSGTLNPTAYAIYVAMNMSLADLRELKEKII